MVTLKIIFPCLILDLVSQRELNVWTMSSIKTQTKAHFNSDMDNKSAMANFPLLANPTIDKGLMKGHVKCLSKATGYDGFYVSKLLQAEESKDPLWAP